jgi:hypothetical protein
MRAVFRAVGCCRSKRLGHQNGDDDDRERESDAPKRPAKPIAKFPHSFTPLPGVIPGEEASGSQAHSVYRANEPKTNAWLLE